MQSIKSYFGLALVLGAMSGILPAYSQVIEREVNPPPIPIPIDNTKTTVPEEQESRAVRSFSNTIAWNEQNRFGFSLGASLGGISDVYPNSADRHPSMLTAFSGGVFTNLGRHKSSLHMEYNAGYRTYYQQDGMNGTDHYGNITYSYQANRKVGFQLYDIISSSLNDPYSSFNPILRTTIDWTPSPSYEVVFQPQRITINQARGQVDLDFTQSTHVYAFGSYDSYWYEREEFGDINGVQVGAGLDQRITNWMFLSSSYSTYLNDINERLRDYQIHRLEIGRFRFKLSRYTEVFFSGGIEVADTRNDYRAEGMFRGGISRSSEKNAIYANYQRTMTSALGYDRILPSDLVTIGYGQRFTPRTSLRLSGSYLRGSDFYSPGYLRGWWGRAQFEYALRADLFASINYAYQYQKNTIEDLADVPHFDRSVVFVGLQFAWPSIRLTSE
jgi:hypothetical protein